MSQLAKLLVSTLLIAQSLFGLDALFQSDSLHGSLGDIISFSWIVDHSPNSTLRLREIDLSGTGIEIIDQQIIPSESGSALSFKTAVYDSVGIYHFPDVLMFMDGLEGQDSLLLSGPDLSILSILTASDTNFRDIKQLHLIRTPLNPMILLWLVILAVLGYLLYRLYLRYQRSHKHEIPEKIIVPPEEAHVIALRELAALRDSNYLQIKNYKSFYSELSHILKQYYENRYLIETLELTTSEFMDKLNSMKEFDFKMISNTKSVLETADFVKFAKGSSTSRESTAYLNQVTNIVKFTKIKTEVIPAKK